MSFTTADIARAVIAAGVFGGAAMLISGGKSPMSALIQECGVQAVASLASDAAFQALQLPRSFIAGPLAAGGIATAIKYFVLHDRNLGSQAMVIAGAQVAAEIATNTVFPAATQ